MVAKGIRREQKLRKRSDFQVLRESRLSRAHPLVVARAAPNALPYARVGFAVGKRVSLKATTRNLIRRRLREIVRQLPLHQGWDLLLISRRPAVDAKFGDLRSAITHLVNRLGLVGSAKDRRNAQLVGTDGNA